MPALAGARAGAGAVRRRVCAGSVRRKDRTWRRRKAAAKPVGFSEEWPGKAYNTTQCKGGRTQPVSQVVYTSKSGPGKGTWVTPGYPSYKSYTMQGKGKRPPSIGRITGYWQEWADWGEETGKGGDAAHPSERTTERMQKRYAVKDAERLA